MPLMLIAYIALITISKFPLTLMLLLVMFVQL
nr:MAG TPA: hypothetical protein [Caudoviricetes sp.]